MRFIPAEEKKQKEKWLKICEKNILAHNVITKRDRVSKGYKVE